MVDRQAFLDQILEQWENPSPTIAVMADWLEERGEYKQASLLRRIASFDGEKTIETKRRFAALMITYLSNIWKTEADSRG